MKKEDQKIYVIPDIVLENMPDTSISLEERNKYGYTWNGMLPLSARCAEELFEQFAIFELGEDNTEHQIESIEELREKADSNAMFGIETEAWNSFIEPQLNRLKEIAAETGLPYSTRFYDEENSEDFVYDGSMTFEDYQKSTRAAKNAKM